MILKKGILFYLIIAVLILSLCPTEYVVLATTSSSEAQEEKDELESDLEEQDNVISALETKQADLESYLSDLNLQLTQISVRIEEISTQIAAKNEEIATTQAALNAAKEQEKQQYADMKKRIQFMYENGDASLVTAMLQADDFTDFLNKTSYVLEMSNYDRNMLEEYQTIKDTIASEEASLKQEQADLEVLETEATAKQEELGTLIQSTASDISAYKSEISTASAEAEKLEASIEAKNQEIEEAKAAEEAAAAKAKAAKEAENTATSDNSSSTGNNSGNSSGSNSGSSQPASASDLALMAAIIECEAGGESYAGQVAVGEVVMNRVHNGSYPNSVLGVIYQSGQFSPVASGRFAIVLATGASASCQAAAAEAMGGSNSVGGLLHFKRNDGVTQGTVIGNHVFY